VKHLQSLLLYCQHSVGIGHLVRSFNLARGLSERFRVVLLNGGPLPGDQGVPAGVEVVQLPPVAMDQHHELVSLDRNHSLGQAQALRKARILACFEETRPSVLLIELYPFGRRKFAAEILPLLDAAIRRVAPPLIVSSVRDILVHGRADQQAHDDLAAKVLHEYFDAVLVHADPDFVRLEETFQPRQPSSVPVHYTGFVVADTPRRSTAMRERRVLVSAGGGRSGLPLFSAAVEAHRALWDRQRLPMTIVAGPLLPDTEWRQLSQRTEGVEGLSLVRSVPHMRVLMERVAASVGRCGYNSAMDILLSGVAALVVPFVEPGDEEQSERARRMERLGLLRTLPPERLGGAALADAIEGLMSFRTGAVRLDLNGAATSARVVSELVAKSNTHAIARAARANA
jgi:predicted glycosyltransferase